jgi:hypothetical protein
MEENENGPDGRSARRRLRIALQSSPGKPITLTPDEARALIDSVFRSHGLDPTENMDRYGWRRLTLGSAEGYAGVIEWQPGLHFLVIFSPIVRIPASLAVPADFYRLLLALNHDGTLAARFSIQDDIVYVGLTRPIRGLDEEEVDDAIRAVMAVADSYDDWLHSIVQAMEGGLVFPVSDLPQIKMSSEQAHAIAGVLAVCDDHGRRIFNCLMEGWQKAGHIVEPGTNGIGLKIVVGGRRYSLAGLRPGVAGRRQLVILGWENLRREGIFPDEAVDHFQATASWLPPLRVTESTAHLEVTEDFSPDNAKELLRALRELAEGVEGRPATNAGNE